MNNKLIQKSLFVGIAVALFAGVVFVSNTDIVFSQNVTNSSNIDLGVTGNDTSTLNSSSSHKTGHWTDGNTTLTASQ